MNYVAANERTLLEACARTYIDGGSCGRMLKLAVLRRCQLADFDIPDFVASAESGVQQFSVVPMRTERFHGWLLPTTLSGTSADGLYIPYNPTFPAIDIVWKTGSHVIGVQVHVSTHKDTVAAFEGLCRGISLYETCDDIEMWFLCPTVAAAQKHAEGLVGKHCCRKVKPPAARVGTSTNCPTQDWSIEVRSVTIHDFDFLEGLPWPRVT
jgi:hypothetical protein